MTSHAELWQQPVDPIRKSSSARPFDTADAREEANDGLIAGTYRLLGRIGMGAMGIVYEAEHVRLARRFAIKVLRSRQEVSFRGVEFFLREARALASVESEYVVSTVDCGQLEDGTPFLVTELLRGQDLRCRLTDAGVLSIEESLQISLDACNGLSTVHASGIVHRDLKPENLFLTRRSSGAPICKLLDFGVAKLAGNPITDGGAIVGTASYMAPEQILDASQVGPQADIYSLGAILFECLTGRPPHLCSNPLVTMFHTVHSPVPELDNLRCDAPPELVDILKVALNPDPQMRFRTAGEFAKALSSVSSSAGTAALSPVPSAGSRDTTAAARVHVADRSHRHRILATGALLGATAASAILVPWLRAAHVGVGVVQSVPVPVEAPIERATSIVLPDGSPTLNGDLPAPAVDAGSPLGSAVVTSATTRRRSAHPGENRGIGRSHPAIDTKSPYRSHGDTTE